MQVIDIGVLYRRQGPAEGSLGVALFRGSQLIGYNKGELLTLDCDGVAEESSVRGYEMKKSIGAKTIVYPTPVFVVGTYDEDGKPNLMTVAWGGICCSSPPCVAISLRKERHTYGNITASKAFTVNIPSESQVAVADYIGCVSGKREDKFAVAGLTPIKSEIVNAPYVKEFPLALECKVIHVIEIGIHTQFIGEILDIKVDEDYLGENNLPDIEKVKPFIYAPDRNAYYGIGEYLAKAFSIGKEIKKR